MTMDYKDLDQVIAYTKKLSKRAPEARMVVYKHPERDNYNITHESRTEFFKQEWVVYRTHESATT